jgi:hypothetical protein
MLTGENYSTLGKTHSSATLPQMSHGVTQDQAQTSVTSCWSNDMALEVYCGVGGKQFYIQCSLYNTALLF